MQSDRFSPDFWRAMAKFGKALADRGLKPIRIARAQRRKAADIVHFDLAIECEVGEGTAPFWTWFIAQDVQFSISADERRLDRIFA